MTLLPFSDSRPYPLSAIAPLSHHDFKVEVGSQCPLFLKLQCGHLSEQSHISSITSQRLLCRRVMEVPLKLLKVQPTVWT